MAHQVAIGHVHREGDDVEIGERRTHRGTRAEASADGTRLPGGGDGRTDEGVSDDGRHDPPADCSG